MTSGFTESIVEQAALVRLEGAGWRVRNCVDIALGEPATEHDKYGRVVLAWLNPALLAEAPDDPFSKLTQPEGADLIERPRALNRLLVGGVTVEYRDAEGSIRGVQARAINVGNPAGDDYWLVTKLEVTTAGYEAAVGAPNRTAKNHLSKLSALELLCMTGQVERRAIKWSGHDW